MLLPIFLFLIFHNIISITAEQKTYSPTWESLDSRPLPSWYDKAKIGIMIHWGVYSVPSFGIEWFWQKWQDNDPVYVSYMNKNYPPGFKYQEFGRDFTAEFFEPDKWAELFKKSGAKYVVLTGKHHDGYTLFPSKYTFGWNSVDVGPHRDLVGDLAKSVRSKTDLKFGLYYSLFEWYHPLYTKDKSLNFAQNTFVTKKMRPELQDLVNTYKPDVIYSEGDWVAPEKYWESKAFLTWLYNESPVKDSVVVNDRWGSDVTCKHGGYYSCTNKFKSDELQKFKWEDKIPIDKNSWGFRRNADISEFTKIEAILKRIVVTVACGGNLLINIGPSKDGTISPIFQERLLQMGEWLNYNGEAIYGSRPWVHQNEPNSRVWYTFHNSAVYAICLDWPENGILVLEKSRDLFVNGGTHVKLLTSEELKWSLTDGNKKIKIIFPDKTHVKVQWAWVLKIYH